MPDYLTDLFNLTGRRAVVTGGSSGIGFAIAEALGRAGAQVTLISRREDRLRQAAEQLCTAGITTDWLAADLSDRSQLDEVIDRILASPGAPDILVTSAGLNVRPPLGDLSRAEWDATMAINLDAPHLIGQRFGTVMATRGWGRIINVASQQSVRAFGNSGAYGVSKAAVAALTRSQAEAWSCHGVCVNAIAPGFVRTPLTTEVFADATRSAAMAARTMIGRNGELADFAGIAVFLASAASSYVTGQVIFVDGGFSST